MCCFGRYVCSCFEGTKRNKNQNKDQHTHVARGLETRQWVQTIEKEVGKKVSGLKQRREKKRRKEENNKTTKTTHLGRKHQ